MQEPDTYELSQRAYDGKWVLWKQVESKYGNVPNAPVSPSDDWGYKTPLKMEWVPVKTYEWVGDLA